MSGLTTVGPCLFASPKKIWLTFAPDLMTQLPLVSVITVVYNGERFLANAIDSVLGQTYPNIEYIIIDGGSKDNTLSIIRRYESKLAWWISEPDKGISDAFNKGIARATGEWVGILNADDWYEPDAVARMMAAANDKDVLYGDLSMWKDGKKDYTVKGNHEILTREMSVNHPTVFVRRSCYQQYGVFDLQYKCAMDYDVMLRFYTNGCRFSSLPGVITNMRWAGVSDKRWFLACKETLAIKNKYLPGRKLLNRLYFCKHVSAIYITKKLGKGVLAPVIKWYRSRFAQMEKVYE